MQDEGAGSLSQQTRGKRRDGTAGAAEGADDAEAVDLVTAPAMIAAAVAVVIAGQQVAGEDGGRAGVDGTEEQADYRERYGLARYVGHPPDEQLEDGRAGDEGVYFFLGGGD